MKRLLFSSFIAISLLLLATGAQAQAKKKARIIDPAPTVISEANGPSSPQNGIAIVQAAEVYKTSLKQLLAAREAEATQAEERFEKLKALYTDGLISRLQFEDAQRELVEIRYKVEDARKQLSATDNVVTESLAETNAGPVVDFEAIRSSRKALKNVAYIRSKGTVNWSAADVIKIEQFFQARFKHALPIASLGQSELHTKWGYDHSNAVDVGLHPDSVEGKTLMNYLSSQGIPFMAFRRAVPGSATGPHIHIGKSSQKTTIQ